MKIKCPACSAELVVDASMSGQVIECTCGKKLRVPFIQGTDADSEDRSADVFRDSTQASGRTNPVEAGMPETPNLGNPQKMADAPLGTSKADTQNPFVTPIPHESQANPYASPNGTGLAYQGLPQGFAIASLVLGVTSLVTTFLCCGGFIFAIPAVICGVIGINQAKQGVASGKGMAVAGLVTGGIVLALTLIGILIYAGIFLFAVQNQGAPPF